MFMDSQKNTNLKKLPKLWIAPLSENIVQAAVDVFDDGDRNIGFIVSENQVGGEKKGYTGLNAALLKEILDQKFSLGAPPIMRDHSSCDKDILKFDCKYFQGIHIDPFKKNLNPFKETAEALDYCFAANPELFFEVGTEEAVFKYSEFYLGDFLDYLKQVLAPEVFSRIVFAVVQCGTKLQDGYNTGSYSETTLVASHKLCRSYNLLPKEHNGDYQSNEQLSKKALVTNYQFSVNIAPEVAFVESAAIYDNSNRALQSKLFDLCMKNPNRKRWFSDDYEFSSNRRIVVASLCHYLYQSEEFKNLVNFDSHLKGQINLHLREYLVGKISSIFP